MKIKVISANAQRAEQVARMVRAGVAGLDVQSASAATFNGLPAFINGSRPALLVLDGIDAAALDAVGLLAQVTPTSRRSSSPTEQSPEFLLKAMQAGVREVLPPAVDGPALQAAVQRIARKRGAGRSRRGTARCSRSWPARAAAAPASSPPTSRTCCRRTASRASR